MFLPDEVNQLVENVDTFVRGMMDVWQTLEELWQIFHTFDIIIKGHFCVTMRCMKNYAMKNVCHLSLADWGADEAALILIMILLLLYQQGAVSAEEMVPGHQALKSRYRSVVGSLFERCMPMPVEMATYTWNFPTMVAASGVMPNITDVPWDCRIRPDHELLPRLPKVTITREPLLGEGSEPDGRVIF